MQQTAYPLLRARGTPPKYKCYKNNADRFPTLTSTFLHQICPHLVRCAGRNSVWPIGNAGGAAVLSWGRRFGPHLALLICSCGSGFFDIFDILRFFYWRWTGSTGSKGAFEFLGLGLGLVG
jgi:hypothetical protein